MYDPPENHHAAAINRSAFEDGKLQLSVYTMKGDDFMEVVADPKTGVIAKAEKITDAGDLKAASSQKAAMARAKVPLLTATETAVKAMPAPGR
jgi:hypothetical protein